MTLNEHAEAGMGRRKKYRYLLYSGVVDLEEPTYL